tara:strand:- start:201 stop:350 length:150 start_codon:yes stop_codon:yes gene_type:complete
MTIRGENAMNKQQIIELLESLLTEPDDDLSIQRINDALQELYSDEDTNI